MKSAQTVLLLTNEPATDRVVAEALDHDDDFSPCGVCHTFSELLAQLQTSPAGIALVDIDPDPEGMFKQLHPAIGRFSNTRFVLLSQDVRSDWLLAAMHAGARDFIVKSDILSNLSQVLRRVLPDGETDVESAGTVITVLSAGGGCGATTLAINLANDLNVHTSEPVLLVDLDVSHSAIAAYLGVQGQYGLADVLSHNGRVDPQLIRSTGVSYSDGLHVLLSPASSAANRTAPLEYQRLGDVLKSCRRAFRFTVVDAPRVPMDVAAVLGSDSLMTLIVLELDVKTIRATQAILSSLARQGIAGNGLLPVVNRYRKRSKMVSFSDAQQALGSVPLARIRNDFRSAIRGMNYGKPLAQVAPRSKVRRDINQLALQIVKASERTPAGSGR